MMRPPARRSGLAILCLATASQLWPWGRILVRDVRAARADLNFSRWGEYSETKRRDKAETMLEQTRDGRMPPSGYVRLHSGSAVSPEDLEILRGWVGPPPEADGR